VTPLPERRRFPPPWSVEELDACFAVTDSAGQKLLYVYYEDEPGRRSAAKLLTRNEAARGEDTINVAVPLQMCYHLDRLPSQAIGRTQ
jgi:hypothetical protein